MNWQRLTDEGETLRTSSQHRIRLGGQVIECWIMQSNSARKLRVRVGPDGVHVIQPASRNKENVLAFLAANERWLVNQLESAKRLRQLRRQTHHDVREILFRGEPTNVRIETTTSRAIGNTVRYLNGEIVVSRGQGSRTTVSRSLENWLRREARRAIEANLKIVSGRLGQRAERVYVMNQRTKWGNCSSRRNLSFNWRLILAPESVLNYIVTHEVVHLAVPDHSAKFWLTVHSLCHDTEKARQWLVRHARELLVDLEEPGNK